MKIEKKIIALSIFALTIGIATVLPLAYFQPVAEATAQNTQPFFTPNIFHIVAIPNSATLYDEPYMTIVYPDGTIIHEDIPDTGSVGAIMCYDITPYGANLGSVDAKIEVYNFHFYSDQGSILNMTHSVAIAGSVPDKSSPNDVTDAIIDWDNDKNTYTFADGTVYDFTNIFGNVESSVVCYASAQWSTAAKGHHNMGGGPVLSYTEGEQTAQALTNLRNAQTLYVDITRIMQVTYKHPSSPISSSVITATPTTNEVLYRIEFPALDDMGRYMCEGGHEGYFPTFEDLGLSIDMFDIPTTTP